MDRLRDRYLRALLDRAHADGVPARLVAFREPLVVLELLGENAAIALLDRGDVPPHDFEASLRRLLEGHQAGLLYVVVTGGGAEARAALAAADRSAPDPNRLGTYHLDATGSLARVAGRRLGLLATAARGLGPPLEQHEVARYVERLEQARTEASRFAELVSRRPHPATRVLGAACIVMFGLTHLWTTASFDRTLLLAGANSGPFVRVGEVWRLLSYAFLHGGVAHLVMNLLGLISFGGFLESLLGWHRYLVLWMAAALGGGIASGLIAGHFLSVGASGALFGLLGAGLVLSLEGTRALPRVVAARMRPRLVGLVALNFAISTLEGVDGAGRVDGAAHAGGAVVGALLAFLPAMRPNLDESPEAPSAARRLAGLLAAALLVLCVALALASGRPWKHGSGAPGASELASLRAHAAHW
jgi:membrane associated rhomboid family serine protease